MDTIPNNFGCDSVITVSLTINPNVTNTVSQVACGSYTWQSTTYTASGNYVKTLQTVHGCDSVVTLNLTVINLLTTINVNGFVLTAAESGATYQWYFNDAEISGATTQNHTAAANGKYKVKISKNGCTEMSEEKIITGVGIDTEEKSAMSIYPNPTNESFFVNVENNATIKLYDMLGNEVLSQAANGKTEINICHLASVVYNVCVLSEKVVIGNGKVVKQ